MKKSIFILFSLNMITICAFCQVSINTKNAQGIFYIDAATDNAGNSSTKLQNDIKVDSNGSLILGLSNENDSGKAKIDITSPTTYGAMRFKDGNEAEGKVLVGDANGYANWGLLKGSGGYLQKVASPYAQMSANTPTPLKFENGQTYIETVADGNYIIMIRSALWYFGTSTRINGTFDLINNTSGSIIDSFIFDSFVKNNNLFSVYGILKAVNTKAKDKLTIQIYFTTSGAKLQMNLDYTQVFFYRV